VDKGQALAADLNCTLQSELHYITNKVLSADPICTLQLEHNAARTEECPRYYTGSTAYMATDRAGWASWHSPFDWQFALRLLRATGERSHSGEYSHRPYERAGAAAEVAA
jgi:hypothetical protein